MRHLFSSVTYIFLTFAAWTAMGSSLLADTATLRVLFGTAGVVVGVGNGKGTLTFHGKTYPFEVSGASFGATLTQTVSELEGRAINLRAPEDLAGNYISLGAGGALAGGAGVARLRNAKGGYPGGSRPQIGCGLSVNLARVTITMM
jgi:hypothetical protein